MYTLPCFHLGWSFIWPKPILHPCMSVSIYFISLNPCGYCNKGYQCYGIAIPSCKHAFHPFYLAQVVKSSNRCLVCGLILHLDWWRTWGLAILMKRCKHFVRSSISCMKLVATSKVLQLQVLLEKNSLINHERWGQQL